MASYRLFTNSPDLKQVTGAAITSTSTIIDGGTVKQGGNVASDGPAEASQLVGTGLGKYSSHAVAGANNTVSVINFNPVVSGVVVRAGGNFAGNMLYARTGISGIPSSLPATLLGLGIRLNDTLTTTAYDGNYRVVALQSNTGLVLNGKYSANSNNVGLISGVPLSLGAAGRKPFDYQVSERYVGKLFTTHIWNGVSSGNQLNSGGSDVDNRNKVHGRNNVRTNLVEVAIRNGLWSMQSGIFTPTQPTSQLDTFQADSELADASPDKFGLKGEFAFLNGAPLATTGDYDALT